MQLAELGFHLRHHVVHRDVRLGEPALLVAVTAELTAASPVGIAAAAERVAAQRQTTALTDRTFQSRHRSILTSSGSAPAAPALRGKHLPGGCRSTRNFPPDPGLPHCGRRRTGPPAP